MVNKFWSFVTLQFDAFGVWGFWKTVVVTCQYTGQYAICRASFMCTSWQYFSKLFSSHRGCVWHNAALC